MSDATKLSAAISTTSNEVSEFTIKLVKKPLIPEPGGGYITISPPTGGDRSTITIYIIAGVSMLIILSVGVIVIRKKVL